MLPRILQRGFCPFLVAMLGLPLSSFVSGCGVPFRYFPQAALGQLELFNRARPIQEVVEDVRVPTRVRELLREIPKIKKFGESRGLKATSNYVDYVALDRPAVVWVVSASPPFQFDSKKWSFPIVGGFTYLGWFQQEAALRYAREIQEAEGLDVDVRGASAYSTLGWFRDPVLSTMIPEGVESRGELVNVVLHESVHASFYIDHQSTFNENIANFVANELTREYFVDSSQSRETEQTVWKAWQEREIRSAARQKKFHEAYIKLEALYRRTDLAVEGKREAKNEIVEQLRKELGLSKERTLNNATLIQYRTYHSGQAEWAEFFEKSCHRDWQLFWKRLETVRIQPEKWFPERQMEDFAPLLRRLGED
jgi:predicted aminopeptidase